VAETAVAVSEVGAVDVEPEAETTSEPEASSGDVPGTDDEVGSDGGAGTDGEAPAGETGRQRGKPRRRWWWRRSRIEQS
jgi:hypothetical protein